MTTECVEKAGPQGGRTGSGGEARLDLPLGQELNISHPLSSDFKAHAQRPGPPAMDNQGGWVPSPAVQVLWGSPTFSGPSLTS